MDREHRVWTGPSVIPSHPKVGSHSPSNTHAEPHQRPPDRQAARPSPARRGRPSANDPRRLLVVRTAHLRAVDLGENGRSHRMPALSKPRECGRGLRRRGEPKAQVGEQRAHRRSCPDRRSREAPRAAVSLWQVGDRIRRLCEVGVVTPRGWWGLTWLTCNRGELWCCWCDALRTYDRNDRSRVQAVWGAGSRSRRGGRCRRVRGGVGGVRRRRAW